MVAPYSYLIYNMSFIMGAPYSYLTYNISFWLSIAYWNQVLKYMMKPVFYLKQLIWICSLSLSLVIRYFESYHLEVYLQFFTVFF